MNIFVLSKNPIQAAQFHCDKHCIKMILESAQLLSTAHHVLDKDVPHMIKWQKKHLIKPTHVNHPCAKWVRASSYNYIWLWKLMFALINEYELRYDKVHAYRQLALFLQVVPHSIPRCPQTKFAQCMPEEYKSPSAVSAYRNYYRGAKRRFAKWRSPAKVPTWFNKGE